MAATEIENFVIVFPDPLTTPVADQEKTRLSYNISYSQDVNSNIRTLSTSDGDGSGVISGLLYVPDLEPYGTDDPCYYTGLVPLNATTQENLPATDFNLIALAPWQSTNCTLRYLASTRLDPIRAFIFYLPDNSTDLPPPQTDPRWDLGDGGAWKSSSHFPVYAVPGFIGSQFMTALTQYSGNVTTVPNGRELIELGVYPSEYVRVYSEIAVGSTTSLPSLWIFLLIVIGVLLLVVATTSITMHVLQRYRRKDLERRVTSGRVDLEALGIKRLTVSLDIIQKMPLFVYTCDDHNSDQSQEIRTSLETIEPLPDTEGSTSDPSTIYKVKITTQVSTLDHEPSHIHAQDFLSDSQPTCPICLEDYETRVSVIRELPCGHIFHPECIDTFLSENSSLCPMCKKSVFPLGYCPVKITNGMVHRERNIRRLRSRVNVVDSDTEEGRWAQFRKKARRLTILRQPSIPVPQSVQLRERRRSSDPETLSSGQERLSRQDIARLRAREFVADPEEENDTSAIDRRSAWRRSIAKIFPI